MAEEKSVPAVPAKKSLLKKWGGLCFKVLLGILFFLILLIVLIVSFRDQLITAAVRKIGPEITGTSVVLEEFATTLNGIVSIRNLQIGNPPGFSQPHIFKVKSLYIKLDIPSLFGTMPVIEAVENKGMSVNYEFDKDGVSNVDVLYSNVDKFFGVPKEKPETTDKGSPEPETETSPLLRRLTITDMTIQSGKLVLPVPDMTLENLGGTSSLRLALRKCFNGLLISLRLTRGSVVKGVSAVGNTGKQLFQSGIDAGEKLKNGVVNLFNTKKQKEK